MSKNLRRILLIATAVLLVGVLATIITLAAIKNPKQEFLGTRYIAHRGLSGDYYQNTALAFQKAAESDFFYGVETDIFRTKDGYWVCAHDENPFEDTAKRIPELTLAEARALPLNPAKAGSAVVTDPQYICTFENYLFLVTRGGKVPIIEIKPEISDADVQSIYAILESYTLLDTAHIISFQKSVIRQFSKLDTGLTLQYLTRNPLSTFFELTVGKHAGVAHKSISKALVDTAHRNGATINVWTVNDKAAADKLVKLGVDYITTDFVLN